MMGDLILVLCFVLRIQFNNSVTNVGCNISNDLMILSEMERGVQGSRRGLI
jgi:hypothetical protein